MLRPILSIFFSFFFCRAFYIGDQDIDTTPQNRAVQPIRRPPVRYVLFMLFHPNVFTPFATVHGISIVFSISPIENPTCDIGEVACRRGWVRE